MSGSVATLALRMWWPVIAVFAILGAAGGYVAVKDAPYAATTTVRVDTAGFGEVAQRSIVETSRLLVDSNRTYAKLVGENPAAIGELRQRTVVEIVATSSVLQLTVSAQVPEQAEQQVDALAEAAMATARELADEQFDKTIVDGQAALARGVLPDRVAEDARRDGIGTAIAEQQDNALRLSAQLSRIGFVLPAYRSGLPTRMAMAIGLLGGAVSGAGTALLLGVGRRRIRRLSELRTASALVGYHPAERSDGLARVAARCSRLPHPLAVVLALPGAERALPGVVDECISALRGDGGRPLQLVLDHVVAAPTVAGAPPSTNGRERPSPRPRLNGSGSSDGPSPALGMPRRAAELAEHGADALLVTGNTVGNDLGPLAGRADVVLLIAQRKHTQLGALARVCEQLAAPTPPIVILVDRERPTGDHETPLPGGQETPVAMATTRAGDD